MKFFSTVAIVSGLAAADNKKVPPRTPPQRLETLSRFFVEYIESHVKPNRPERAANQVRAVERINDPLLSIFLAVNPKTGIRRCSFFDPNVPNGGPRPSTDTRKRRDADDSEDPFDAYESRLENGERSTSVRLSADPALALRQVNTDPVLKSVQFHPF